MTSDDRKIIINNTGDWAGSIGFALIIIAIIIGMMWQEWLMAGAPRFWC